MSHRAQDWAWSLRIPAAQKFVAVALADFADEQESCYPGHERLAEMTSQSVSTVQRALNGLERAGLIVRERRHTKAGYRTSDRYFLQVDVRTIEAVEPPAPAAEEEPADAADEDPEPPAEMNSGPVDNSPTGQSAYKANGGAYRSSSASPTGHGDRAKVNLQGEPPGEPPGGASAPAPSPTCGKHPRGTTKGCHACRAAREAFDTHRAVDAAAARAAERAARGVPTFDPAVHCEHWQLLGACDACDREARLARQALEAAFGVLA